MQTPFSNTRKEGCASSTKEGHTGRRTKSSFRSLQAYHLRSYPQLNLVAVKLACTFNSGHGSYGVTLGMGSGKIMSQLVLGEEPCVNVSKLGISLDTA